MAIITETAVKRWRWGTQSGLSTLPNVLRRTCWIARILSLAPSGPGTLPPKEHWDPSHPPLRCQGSLHSQTCWSPPGAAARPPDGAAYTRPCREPAGPQGWTSAPHAIPRHPVLPFPTPARNPLITGFPRPRPHPAQAGPRGRCPTDPRPVNPHEHFAPHPPAPRQPHRQHFHKPEAGGGARLQNMAGPKSECPPPLF